MMLGLNYPRGPLAWADSIGLDHVLAVLDACSEYREERYRERALSRRPAGTERRAPPPTPSDTADQPARPAGTGRSTAPASSELTTPKLPAGAPRAARWRPAGAHCASARSPTGMPSGVGTCGRVAQVPLGVQRRLAARAGGGDRLAVGVVDQVARGEHARAVGPRRAALDGHVAVLVDVDLPVHERRLRLVADRDERARDLERRAPRRSRCSRARRAPARRSHRARTPSPRTASAARCSPARAPDRA